MRWKRAASESALAALVALAAGAAQAAAFELPFWASPQARGDARLIALHEPPGCAAPIAIARVLHMPAAGDGALRADVAIEFGPGGEEIRRWPLPANSVVLGLAGKQLLVPWPQIGGRTVVVAIDPDGSLSLAGVFDLAVAAARLQPADCPAGEVLGMENPRCWTVRDALSGQERRLAYPRPCA